MTKEKTIRGRGVEIKREAAEAANVVMITAEETERGVAGAASRRTKEIVVGSAAGGNGCYRPTTAASVRFPIPRIAPSRSRRDRRAIAMRGTENLRFKSAFFALTAREKDCKVCPTLWKSEWIHRRN